MAVAHAREIAVSPRAARKGESAGAPGLWGGVIRDARRSGDAHCVRVVSHVLDANSGRPVRKESEQTSFLACQGQQFDPKIFGSGTYATFAGRVAATTKSDGLPVLEVTDAKAWGQVGEPANFIYTLAPQGYDQGARLQRLEAAYDRRN